MSQRVRASKLKVDWNSTLDKKNAGPPREFKTINNSGNISLNIERQPPLEALHALKTLWGLYLISILINGERF